MTRFVRVKYLTYWQTNLMVTTNWQFYMQVSEQLSGKLSSDLPGKLAMNIANVRRVNTCLRVQLDSGPDCRRNGRKIGHTTLTSKFPSKLVETLFGNCKFAVTITILSHCHSLDTIVTDSIQYTWYILSDTGTLHII